VRALGIPFAHEQLGEEGAHLKPTIQDKLIEHKHSIDKPGEDLPAIRPKRWGAKER
jgi:xylulose-5-phosphate/fructose-6-phosphate phosphoketolase